MKSARKARDQAATANAPLLYVMEAFIMDDIVNIISSVGFPIAMTLLLFWYMTKQNDRIDKQNEAHKEETNSLKDAINKLEVAITALITKIGE